MRDDIDPDRIGTRTVDKRVHRENVGTGFAYLNSTQPVDYDRVEELPPAVYGLLAMNDVRELARRYRAYPFRRVAA